MAIFHLFTVTPIDGSGETAPAVSYGNYYVTAPTLACAFSCLKEDQAVAGAAEVYGAERSSTAVVADVLLRPSSTLSTQESLSQHKHWLRMQERYELLAQGAESLDQFFARKFAERFPRWA